MKSLLLVIDLQKGWRYEDASEEAMLNTVDLCKKFKGDMIHCCFKNNPESLFYKQLRWKRFMVPMDTDQIPEIKVLNIPVYWQSTYSRVNNETLPILKKYDHVYIAGVFTDVSVASTAMDIFDCGIPVSIVKDCVGTLHGPMAHEYALHSLDFSIGPRNMVNSSDLV